MTVSNTFLLTVLPILWEMDPDPTSQQKHPYPKPNFQKLGQDPVQNPDLDPTLNINSHMFFSQYLHPFWIFILRI